MSDHHIRTTCRLCDSFSLVELLRFQNTCLANEYPQVANPFADTFPLYLVGCRACGHVQLPVVVDPKRLFPADYAYRSGTSEVFRKHLEELAEVIARTTSCKVLDIACNDGQLVNALIGRGTSAYGIDPCAPDGPQFYRDFFTAAWATRAAMSGKARCITALNVFAHVDDLSDFTRGVEALLEHDGMFIFEVGYLPDVLQRGLFPTIYHEHLSYHTLAPLVPFFRRHGMELVDAHRIDSQGGSIRGFVRNCGAHQQQSDSLRELLTEEMSAMLEDGLFRRVRELKETAKYVGRQMANFVKQIRSGGGELAGYGAPAKLTTLLAATNLFPSSIDYVLDDNPLKCGRYVPGTRIPIVPSSELGQRNPAGIMLFSSNFASEIQERHAEYKGRWFVT